MSWLLCVLLPGLSWAADISTHTAGFRSPGYWTLPSLGTAMSGRLPVRLTMEGDARAKELSIWLVSRGAKPIEGPDIQRTVWVLPVERLKDLQREAGKLGFRVEHASPAPPCDAGGEARAKADLKTLVDEFAYVEDYRTRLESVLFLTAAYTAALGDILETCTLRKEAIVYLEPELYVPFWAIPKELTYAGPQNIPSAQRIRVPPLTGEPPEDYLRWGELIPLYLCSGKATFLTVSELFEPDESRKAVMDILAPYKDRPFTSLCPNSLNIAPGDVGARVQPDSLPAIKAKLSSIGRVKEEEVLFEARFEPRRREAHLWYASLQSELDDAGEVLRKTPHIDAFVRDEVARLPLYFASSEDPEGRRLVFIRLRR